MADSAVGEGVPFQFELAEDTPKLLDASDGLRLLAGELEVAHVLCHEKQQGGQPGGFPSLMLRAKLGIDRAGPEPPVPGFSQRRTSVAGSKSSYPGS
eukprot:9601691-Alexandrium_andersonii.AAC.1